MTIGTRILLALSAVFIVVLVAYYGFFNQTEAPRVAADDPAGTDQQSRAQNSGDDSLSAPNENAVDREPDAIEMGRPIDEAYLAARTAELGSWQDDSPAPPPSDRRFDPTASGFAYEDHPARGVSPVQAGDRAASNDGDRHSFLPLTRIVTGPSSVGKESDYVPAPQSDPADDVVRPARTETPRNPEVITPGAAGTSGGGGAEAPRPLTPVQIDAPTFTPYRVQNGDTMSSIAESWFGTPNKWDLIAKANPLVDPNRLRVGQSLRLPPRNATRAPTVPPSAPTPAANQDGRTIYQVKPGDTLSSIAGDYYGDNTLWKTIYDANRATIGSSPNTLKVGMKLEIPPAPKRAGG